MFDFIWKKKLHQPITLTLEDISVIWTKYNRVFEHIVVKNDSPDQNIPMIKPENLIVVDPDATTTAPPAVVSSATPTVTTETPAPVSSSSFNTFVQDIVQPYRNNCDAQNALGPIMSILTLLETEGTCPSIGKISNRLSDSDGDYITIQDALSKVTLRDHSHRVAKIAIKLLKESYRDYLTLVPKMLVCALAHDIGKIPSFRMSNEYAKADHPIIGGRKLREILSSPDETARVSWIDKAVEIVELHHQQSKDQFLCILQAADSQARREEVAVYRKDFVLKKWNEWFSLPELIESIKKEINVVTPHTKNQWQSFSFNGVVYCKPDALALLTIQQAKSKKVFDTRFLHYERNIEAVLIPIVNSLRENQVIVENPAFQTTFGGEYEIDLGTYKDSKFLIPLKMEFFRMASDFESNKSSFFHSLQGVRLKTNRKKMPPDTSLGSNIHNKSKLSSVV